MMRLRPQNGSQGFLPSGRSGLPPAQIEVLRVWPGAVQPFATWVFPRSHYEAPESLLPSRRSAAVREGTVFRLLELESLQESTGFVIVPPALRAV